MVRHHAEQQPVRDLSKGEHLLTPNGTVVTADGGTTPKVHDGSMWDLTVPGNNDHDFYVSAGDTPVLVHNTNCGPGLRTADEAGIRPSDAQRIQNAATRTGQRITVAGSRANGTAGSDSDWDYILSGPSRARGSAKFSLPRGVGGDWQGRRFGIDIFQDYNPEAPGYTTLAPDLPHVIFDP